MSGRCYGNTILRVTNAHFQRGEYERAARDLRKEEDARRMEIYDVTVEGGIRSWLDLTRLGWKTNTELPAVFMSPQTK